MITRVRSALGSAGVRWPAVPSARTSRLLALLYQLEESEWWSAAELLAAQQTQADALLEHARKHVPFYASRLGPDFARNVPALGSDEWLQVPELSREEVQESFADLRATIELPAHGRFIEARTSGSTGQPVAVLRTELTQLFWEALTLRDHLWQKRDASLPMVVIRANGPPAPAPHGRRFEGWGAPFDGVWRCGTAFALDMTTDVGVQADFLRRTQPAYLLTYPTNLDALLDCFEDHDAPRLREVLCVGETASDRLRRRTHEVLRATLSASYSSQEVGYIALQCPDCGQYHVQSESIFVEVLDDDGRPCAIGDAGRVVVTDLHNFAMPLIRYAIGDYAEVGDTCSAGRGLPSLRNILGRRRNMIVFPDGRRHWPLTGFHRFDEVAPIRRYQFVQHTREHIEVRLAAAQPLSKTQLEGLEHLILETLGHPFRLSFNDLQEPLATTAGGKFEEFVCLAN